MTPATPLAEKLTALSQADTWEQAVSEWDIDGCGEDESLASSCVCGKERIRYLFTIRNRRNGNTLYPIGSSCVRKLGPPALREAADITESLFRLRRLISSGGRVTLTSDCLSRKLLAHLHTAGAFRPNAYNAHNPYRDYAFLLDMFNKRSPPTPRQQAKINALIATSVKPFLTHALRPQTAPP